MQLTSNFKTLFNYVELSLGFSYFNGFSTLALRVRISTALAWHDI